MNGTRESLPRHVTVMQWLSRREMPAPVCGVAVDRSIEVPAGDGVVLLTDHYIPLSDGPSATLLVRTPYGRGFPWDNMYGALFAGQGFHVVIQSCRGTGGSGGEFEPFVADAGDGEATLAWLREQDWFNGRLGTIGASYLGYVQYALATSGPAELGAMVVQVSSDDFRQFLYPGGAFALQATLTGTAAMVSMERGFASFMRAVIRLARHHKRAESRLPLLDAYPAAFGQRVPFFEEWLAHPDPDGPFWADRRAETEAASLPPVSLLTGWSDVCLDPTLAQYRRLRDAGKPVRLVVGPWDHTSGFSKDMPVVFGEALRWLRAYLCDDVTGLGELPVRLYLSETGGPGQWRDLADWPPPDSVTVPWYLHDDGSLAATSPAGPGVSSLRYDPAAPTPSVGGPSMDSRNVGSLRNDKLEARSDVLTFTSPPLAESLEVIGPVGIRLRVRASGPHFDVFARLCDVDAAGHSWNVCDGLIRLGAQQAAEAGTWIEVTVPMSAAAHRFGAGHRIRVQISGGAHPRFARNTGTGEPLATATRLVPVEIEIGHDQDQPGELALPVLSPG